MTGDRVVVGVLAVVAAAIAVVVLMLLLWPRDPTPAPVGPAPRPARVAPVGAPAPSGARIALTRPPSPTKPRKPFTPDDKFEMNTAVDEVVRAARAACLQAWVDSQPEPKAVELVLDVVSVDGVVTDLGLRSLGEPLTPDVVDCVADEVWSLDWPVFPLEGESRLQRSFELTPKR